MQVARRARRVRIMDSVAPVVSVPVVPARDPGDGRRVPLPLLKFAKRGRPLSEDEDLGPDESEPRQVDITV